MVSETEKWDAYTISRKQSSVRDIHFPIFDANSMTPSATEKQNINKSLTHLSKDNHSLAANSISIHVKPCFITSKNQK